ncbi:hypothetical protein BGZ57DRAFT_820878 [Hyaloscypha finlandica]|nr:hypothetical protein BGZ57DRAFT_820878 [Hyaloscypha finlandica]
MERTRLVAIPWKELSTTFQDAFIITNNLGYRYLWIDSLCIIQNDHRNWGYKLKNMAFIYRNSILKIAPSKLKDGNGVCSTSTTHLPGKVALYPYTKSPTGIYYRRQLAHSHYYLQPWKGRPLHRRAWTFQGELLSIRLLCYGPEEIVWRCNTIVCYQCGTIGYFNVTTSSNFQDKSYCASGVSIGQPLDTSARDHQRELHIRWYKLVLGYCSRFLTKESDGLPALSGLTKQVQTAGLAPLATVDPANNVHLGTCGNLIHRSLPSSYQLYRSVLVLALLS